MTVRGAVAADKMRVIAMLKAAHAAGGLPFPFSAAHAVALFDEQCHKADRLCLVLAPAGVAHGILMASAQPHPFADIRYASEVVFWVDQEHRGSCATRMLAAYEAWARDVGCSFVGMAALTAFPRAGLIYERRGYRPVETFFLKQLAPISAA